jgi:L-ribulose-5-phosphate 3-epimerase
MNDEDIDRLNDRLTTYGLTPIALSVAADLTTAEGVSLLAHTCRVANRLDVRTVVANIEETGDASGARRFMGFVPAIIAEAERYDVCIALEIHGGLIDTGLQGARLLDEIGSPRIKMTYDMANVVYYSGILPEKDLLSMGDAIGTHIGHVHLKDKANLQTRDYDFPAFGRGVLNVRKVAELLRTGGYVGPMTLEVELDGAPATPELVDEAIFESYEYVQSI